MRCSRYQKDTAENVTDWDRSLDLSLSLLPRACSRWPRECQNQLCGRRQACSLATLRAGQDPRALCPAFVASWAKASRRKRSKGGWIPPSSNDFKPFEHRRPRGRRTACLDLSLRRRWRRRNFFWEISREPAGGEGGEMFAESTKGGDEVSWRTAIQRERVGARAGAA